MRTGDQIVQDLPWRWNVQGKIFLIGGLGYLFDAWDIALNGFLTPLVALDFDLSDGARGYVATANLIGMAIGAIVWGSIADRLGRKKAFSITLMIFAIFSVLGAFSPTYGVFLAFRFLAGFGLGGCIPVDYAIVGEFSPKAVRGKVLTALDLFWPIGATLAGLSAWALLDVEHNWRIMLGIMVLPALLTFWVRRGIPESPIYLAKVGREAEAREIIDRMVRETGATPEPYEIKPPVVEAKVNGIVAGLGQLRMIWSRMPMVTLMAWMLFVSIMVVYYAALSWLPTLLRDAGATFTVAFLGSTIMSAIGIFGCALSAVLVDITGRKWLLGVSASLGSLALVGIGYTLEMTNLALVAIGVFGFLIQMAIPVLYAYIAEIYPTEIRASGFAWSSSASRVATGVAPIAFSAWMFPTFGLVNTFIVLSVAVFIAVAMMAKFGPETKGMDLDAVVEPGEPAPARTPVGALD
ncbi:MFS transporter [Janibacter sp. Soil728]|uniref:MFS transporter n=1 Tax=Janibacter sp. Soil728 TaxID=1736393 RepID=UPI0006F7394A|nr:MFS transporter [Janibacter sp. Soil728]KRE38935.1 MFS transporter [Janibacter sp. Soil728]